MKLGHGLLTVLNKINKKYYDFRDKTIHMRRFARFGTIFIIQKTWKNTHFIFNERFVNSAHERLGWGLRNKEWSFTFCCWRLEQKCSLNRRSPEVYCKKGVLKNFAKFTGKHLCQSLFFKKETLAQMFSCEFCKIFKSTFL